MHPSLSLHAGNSSRPVTTEDLSKLPYLKCVVKESLRILPSVPYVFRALEEDITLGKQPHSYCIFPGEGGGGHNILPYRISYPSPKAIH